MLSIPDILSRNKKGGGRKLFPLSFKNFDRPSRERERENNDRNQKPETKVRREQEDESIDSKFLWRGAENRG